MTCRNCKWLDVGPDKAGRRTVRKDRAYRCIVEVPQPAFPMSVTTSYNFRWPPLRRQMEGSDGDGCPLFADKSI